MVELSGSLPVSWLQAASVPLIDTAPAVAPRNCRNWRRLTALEGNVFAGFVVNWASRKASSIMASPTNLLGLSNCIAHNPEYIKNLCILHRDRSYVVLYDDVRASTCQRL